MKLIPAIDLSNGVVVRLRQGDFDRSRRYDVDPAVLASRYRLSGADWLHVVDLDGARNGRPMQVDWVASLVACGLKLQWGGGVRTRDDVEWLLANGVHRVIAGSVAVKEPDVFMGWLRAFGGDRLALALDVRQSSDGSWRPAVDAWRSSVEQPIEKLLDSGIRSGLRHVLCTDIDRDGMARGPNLALYRELTMAWPELSWIASGGVRDRADLRALAETGVAACVSGSALLDGTLEHESLADVAVTATAC